jgi:hypothetical protein
MTRNNNSSTFALALLLAAVVAFSAMIGAAGLVGAATTTDLTVSITDDDDTIAPGETTTVEIAVATADGGVGAASFGVELSDSSVAQITDVSVTGTTTTPDIAPDESSADVRYFQADTSDTGEVVFATVTLQAQGSGSTDIDVVDNSEFGTLLVGDEGGAGYTLQSIGSATLTVSSPPNSAPSADAGDDQTVDEGDPVTLDASGSSDADGSIASYAWTQTGGASVSLSDASTAQPTFTAPDVSGDETLTFEVAVTDDDGETATDAVTITVEDTDVAPPPEIETSVSLAPATDEVAVGQSATFDLVVSDADGGVGAFDATVSLDDDSVAAITGVEIHGNPGEQTTDVDIAADNASVDLTAALMDTGNGGSVPIATITVEGEGVGTVGISPQVSALGNESGFPYDVTGTSGASLTVTQIIVGDFENPVTDPDGDGQYEDINGNGNYDIIDVQALFANLDDPAVQNNVETFDFNGDGVVNVVDVQKLFFDLIL